MDNRIARPAWALALVSLILGPAVAMLWQGKWKWTIFYGLLSLIPLGILLHPLIADVFTVPGLSALSMNYVVRFVLKVIGGIHAIALRHQALARPWYSRWYVALPVIPLTLLAVLYSITTWFYQPFNLPSGSNYPGYVNGDYVWVSKRAYAAADPRRGDMAVFWSPDGAKIPFVKRVMAIPGDRIALNNGVVILNGAPLAQAVEEVTLHIPDLPPQASFYRETLPGGRSYVVTNLTDHGEADTMTEIAIPEGMYFVLGDSRDNSMDSHFPDFGLVPRENFIGPVVGRSWNSEGISLKDRPQEIVPE